ncbi:MAG: hypothetical protein GX964_02900 [Syntrophomonadaceae bacterium]|jgi:hypothetical protein|nr:hypothetical protein [Syntrophomonadaceae bacterium]
MTVKRGQIISKEEFMAGGHYGKEQYEGLLVSGDVEHGYLQLGVQLDEDRVLVVDSASEDNVRERIQNWAPQIQKIQKEYGSNMDLQNYS